MLAALADLSLTELLLIAGMAVVASIIGGVAGYGTGALMPLVLVPIVGAEPVVPIIAISALFTNTSRAFAFRHLIDWRRAAIIVVAALITTALGAWGYTLLTGRGAMLVIGSMLALSVPLRRLSRRHGLTLTDGGLGVASVFWGFVVGGTSGAGIILLSLLMAVGLQGAAVIATDAAISVIDRHREDRGVRRVRRGDAEGGRGGAADRRRGVSRRVSRQGAGRAAAGARAHRDPRCGGDHRRAADGARAR